MEKKVIITFLFLSIFFNSFSTNIEDYYGRYTSINKGIRMNFLLNEKGVTDLHMDGVDYDVKTYDFLGVFGDSEVLEIRFSDKNRNDNIIKMFIVTNQNKFVISAGYYIKFDSNSDDHTIIKKKALEFKFNNNISSSVLP